MSEMRYAQKIEQGLLTAPEKVVCAICGEEKDNLTSHLSAHRNLVSSTEDYKTSQGIDLEDPLMSRQTLLTRAKSMKSSVLVKQAMSRNAQTWQQRRRQALGELRDALDELGMIPVSQVTDIPYNTLISAINQSRLDSTYVTPITIIEDRVVAVSRPIYAVDMTDLETFKTKSKRKKAA